MNTKKIVFADILGKKIRYFFDLYPETADPMIHCSNLPTAVSVSRTVTTLVQSCMCDQISREIFYFR